MIYIRLADNDIVHKSIKNKFFKRFSKLRLDEFDGKKLLEIRDLSNKTLNKISKYLKSNCINKVCLSDNLLNNNVFLDFIKKENIAYFNGKWLFKHMMINCAEYICNCKKEKLEYQEISILSNDINWNLVYNIKKIAEKARIVNIVTNYENKFRKLEKELYEEGIILNVNNNYKKSLAKSDIIFNFDFFEEELNKYVLPKKSCIINFENEVLNLPKSFEGINSNFFEINMPRKYLDKLLFFKGFNTSILCESFIYKNTMPYNIFKQINDDNITITFLEGKNGKIRKTEYLKLSKKIAN